MTRTRFQRLLTARAFAEVLISGIDHELDGKESNMREEAVRQLKAALEALESED